MWQSVEHGSEIFKHTDMACWLSDKLNEMGASQMYVLQFDPNSDVFRAVAFVPDKSHTLNVEPPRASQKPPIQADYGKGVFCDE